MNSNSDYFKTFCKISKAFGTTLDKEALLNMIVQSAIDSMDGKAACLFLSDENTDVFIPAAQKGLSNNYLHASPAKAKEVISNILKEGGYLAVKDAATDPRVENHEAKKAEGIASILNVPVMVNDKAIGVLTLYTAMPRDFTPDEVDFLSALAEQGGLAIQNARLVERMNKNSILFFDLASNINSSQDIKKIFHILSADIGETFGMKGVSIRLYNPKTKMMDMVASYGLSEEFLNKGPVSAEKSKVVRQILKGNTIFIQDASADERVQYRKEAKKEGIVSVLSVPIKSGEKVIGELRLSSGVEREFPESMVNLIKALANQGGIAIENAKLIHRMRMNTEFFHDLAVNINSTLDVKSIMHIMTADIAETLGVKAASIRLVNEETGTLELVASYGLSERYMNKGAVSREKGIPEALRNRAVVVNDVSEDDGVLYRKEKQAEGIVSILSVPINARDDVIGVLRLYSDVPREFTEDDIMLVSAMAHQGGLAIQNASLYLKLQEDKKDLEEDIWTHKLWF